MKKRLLALLLIVCFVVAIPCQALAASNVILSEQTVSTSNDMTQEETVVVEEKTQPTNTDEAGEGDENYSSDNDSSIGGELLKEKVEEANNNVKANSSKKSVGTVSTGSSDYDCYPGGKYYYVRTRDGGSTYWTYLSIGYKAYKVDSQGNKVYGFTTCAHGLYERANNFVYSKENGTEEDIIGIVYENGYEITADNSKTDYSFVMLLPGKRMANITAYEKRTISGMGEIAVGTVVWKEGSTAPYTNDSIIGYTDVSAEYNGNPFHNIDLVETSSGLSKRGDSGGIVYKAGTSGTYQAVGINSGTSSDENLPMEERYSYFVRADRVRDKHNIYVHSGTEVNTTSTKTNGGIGSISWILQSGTLYISGSGDMPDFYCAPWSHLYKDIRAVVVHNGVTSIGDYAFYNCYNLTNVTLGKDVKSIGYNAFAWCCGLTSVDIPESVKAINHHAFYHCDNLKEIRFMGEISEGIEELAFEKVEATAYYPSYYYVWDSYIKSNYGGKFEWIPYDKETGDVAMLRCYNDPDTGVNVLEWDSVSSARKYNIYRSEGIDGNYELIATATNNEAYFDNLSVPNTVYYYYVIAQANKNVFSNKVSLVCDCAKPKLTVSNIESTGKPYLEWEPVEGAQEYMIYKAYTSSFEKTVVITTSDTSYIEEGEGIGGSLYYKIVACGEIPDFADSVFSDVQTVTTRYPRPTLNVSVDESTGKPKVSGECDVKPHFYYAYYATNIDGPYSSLPRSLVHEEAVWGQKYYYKIQACHAAGPSSNTSSALSEPVSYKYGSVGISTDSNSGKPKIYWDTINNANEYVVYRSTDAENGFSETGMDEDYKLTGNTYEFVDDNAVVGTTYYYKVEAKIVTEDTTMKSITSVVINCTCKLPQPVATIKNNTSNGKPEISWDKIEGAYGYRVYRSTNNYQRGKLLHTMGDTTCIDYSAEPNKIYYYSVQAFVLKNNLASSEFSKSVSIMCNPIASVTVTLKSNEKGVPYLMWKSITGTSNYKVFRAEDDGVYNEIGCVSSNINTYTDKLAVPGNEYYYRVEALRRINANEVLLAQSTEETCICKCEAPKLKVESFKVSSTAEYARLSFGISRGAKTYIIYRSTDNKGYKKIAVINNQYLQTYTDKTVEPGVKYYYKVRAVPANGNLKASTYSNIKTFYYNEE